MILQRLKQETSSYHQQIERDLNICDEHLTLARYTHILAQFLGFYQPVELRLSTFQRGHILNREIAQRDKTPWLLQDLQALGYMDAELHTLPSCTELPTLDTIYQALGCMYVLEGATLGGQIISRHIQRALRLNKYCGCAFFHGYGPDTGAMWKAFGKLLTAYVSTREAENAIISSASNTFIVFHQWLLIGARV